MKYLKNFLIILSVIFIPIIGILIILYKYPDVLKNSKIKVPLVIWFLVWFVIILYPLTNQETSPIFPKDISKQSNTNEGSIMEGVSIKEPEDRPYVRDDYQPNWNIGEGCDLRSRILSSTSKISVKYSSNGCGVEYGSWNDPYTGQIISGDPYQGDGTTNDLDIDHVIPLEYVNSHGGYYWTERQKRTYGSSITALRDGVYIAVLASENRKKSNQGPSAYYPPNPLFKCNYAKLWRDIARKYKIYLSKADYYLVKDVMIGCNG